MIGLLYILFFLYSSANNIRISAELLLSSTLPETPLLAIIILMVLAICYVLYLGIEVLARTAEVFIVILIFLGLIGNLFVFLSGNVDLHNLQPIFGKWMETHLYDYIFLHTYAAFRTSICLFHAASLFKSTRN